MAGPVASLIRAGLDDSAPAIVPALGQFAKCSSLERRATLRATGQPARAENDRIRSQE